MANFLTNKQALTAGTVGAWTDLSLAAYIPADASVVILNVQITDDQGLGYSYGLRPKGGTDTWTGYLFGYGQCEFYCTVGTSRTIQYFKNNANLNFWIRGYFTTDAIGLTNGVLVSSSIPAAWTVYDLSATCPAGTQFALFRIQRPGGAASVALRCNGSTDNRQQTAATHSNYGAIMGVDGNRRIQMYGPGNSSMVVYLVGYVTQGRRRTNGLDKSLTVTGSYQAINVVTDYPPFGYAGAVIEHRTTGASAFDYCYRSKGSTNDHYTLRRSTIDYVCVGLDSVKEFQLKIQNLAADTYVLGYLMKPSIKKTLFPTHDVGEFKNARYQRLPVTTQKAFLNRHALSSILASYRGNLILTDAFIRCLKGSLVTETMKVFANSFSLLFVYHLNCIISEVLDIFGMKSIASDIYPYSTPMPDAQIMPRQIASPMYEPWPFSYVLDISESFNLKREYKNKIVDSGLLFNQSVPATVGGHTNRSVMLDISEGIAIVRSVRNFIVGSGIAGTFYASNSILMGNRIERLILDISTGVNVIQSLKTKIEDSGLLFKGIAGNALTGLISGKAILDISEGFKLLRMFKNTIVDSGLVFNDKNLNAIGNINNAKLLLDISEGFKFLESYKNTIVDSGLVFNDKQLNAIGNINNAKLLLDISEGFNRIMAVISSGSEPAIKTQVLRSEIVAVAALFTQYLNSDSTDPVVYTPSATMSSAYAFAYPDDIGGATVGWDLLVDGKSVRDRVLSINVTCNESEYVNSIEVTLSGADDLKNFDPDITSESRTLERIELRLPSYSYWFLLETVEVSYEFAKQGTGLYGRQKSAILLEPFSDKIQNTYINTMASDIAMDLVGDLAIIWDVDDYLVTKLDVDGYPLEVIAELAEAIGGIVRTQIDGNIIVRSKYPVRPNDLSATLPDIVFNENNVYDMDVSQEQPLYSAVKIQLSKNPSSTEDYQMEASSCAELGSPLDIYVYKPNQGSTYTLKTLSGISLAFIDTVTETLDEVIELIDGSGSTNRRINDVLSYVTEGCNGDCGDLEWVPGSTSVTASNATCAVLRIQYTAKYDHWVTVSSEEKHAIICVMEGENAQVTAIKCIKGYGRRSADDISNALIFSEAQARCVGETFLNDHYYKKIKIRISSFFHGLTDGNIATVMYDNFILTGIVRSVALSFTLKNEVLVIDENVEVYCYHEILDIL